MVAVEFPPIGTPTVHPGFPRLKLWPESVTAVSDGPSVGLPRLHPDADKRAYSLSHDGFARIAVPLGRVYVMAVGDSAGTDRLSASESVIELVRHSHCVRSLVPEGRSPHFLQCVRVARAVPVVRLTRTGYLDRLRDLASLILDDIHHHTQWKSDRSSS